MHTDSQAKCPTCGEVVQCTMLEYVRMGTSVHNMVLYHEKCDTTWKLDLTYEIPEVTVIENGH